jgi:HEAT repeat protein
MTTHSPRGTLRRATLVPLLLLLVSGGSRTAYANGFSHPTATPRPLSLLIKDLQSPELRERRIAARELSTMNPLPVDAIDPLVRALNDPDPMGTVQQWATQGLGNGGAPAIPVLVALMQPGKGKKDQIRIAAVRSLAAIAKNEPSAFPPLVETLKDPVLQVWAPVAIAPIGAPIVPLLRKSLRDPDVKVRRAAASALQMAPGQASEAAPELTSDLNDPDPNVRTLTAADLGRIGPPAKSAAPALCMLLKDTRPEVREMAAIALAKVDPENQAPVPILIQALENAMSVAHWDAPDALKGMGTYARGAVPTLEHLLATDPDARFRAAIVKILGPIQGSKSIPALVRVLERDDDVLVRRAALDAINQLLPTAPKKLSESAIAPLIQALRDDDQQIRATAAEMLGSMGKQAKPALIAALKSQDLYIRQGAVRALARLAFASNTKPFAGDIVRALTAAALHDRSFVVRYEAASALDRAGIKPGYAALETAQQEPAGLQAPALAQSHHLYQRNEIFLDIPPDVDHEYPLRLVYLLSLQPAPPSEMLVTVYRGKDRPDRLIFWRTAGKDRYEQLRMIDADPGNSFDAPIGVSIPKGQVPGLIVGFVDVGVNLWRGHGDLLFAIDRNELRSVEIESPEQWYRDKLKPGEEIVGPAANSFHDREAGFRFCVRAGQKTEQVLGTYRVIKIEGGGGAWGMYVPSTHQVIRGTTPPTGPTWKLVVDDARREPLTASSAEFGGCR